MRVLHNFDQYMPSSQNWAYRLLRNVPDVEIHIQSEEYLQSNYYHADWDFWSLSHKEINHYYNDLNRANPLRLFYRFLIKYILRRDIKRWRQTQYKRNVALKKIDLIHSHFGTTAIKYHNLIKTTQKPHIISFYGYDYEMAPYKDPTIMDTYNVLFEEAAAFICEGTHGAKTLEKYGCPKEKIHVVHLGLNADDILSKPRAKSKNSLQLVQIANYTEKKGHIYTVEAFGKALQQCPNMHLTLVGSLKHEQEKWIENSIHKLIEKYQLKAHISIVEAIDFSKLYDYLRQFDVFIHPSCYAKNMDCEGGAPVVILDAQSVGLPVISTRHCDIPDEVVDSKTGLLCEEKNIDEVAVAIQQFYEMEATTYTRFSKAAIEHVKTAYNVRESGAKLSAIYRSVLEKGSSRLR